MLDRLEELGLQPKEARIYLTILERGHVTVRQVADAAGVSRTNAYDIVNRLARRGLVSQLKTGPKQRAVLAATDPQRLIEEWEERRRLLEEVVPELRASHRKSGVKPRVRYYEGVEGIRTVLYGTLRGAGPLLGILSMEDLLTVPGEEATQDYIKQRVARGLELKVVRSREKEINLEVWPTDPGALREMRYAPAGRVFTMTMILSGDTVSLMSSREENFGLTIESPEYAELQRNLFGLLWDSSTRS